MELTVQPDTSLLQSPPKPQQPAALPPEPAAVSQERRVLHALHERAPYRRCADTRVALHPPARQGMEGSAAAYTAAALACATAATVLVVRLIYRHLLHCAEPTHQRFIVQFSWCRMEVLFTGRSYFSWTEITKILMPSSKQKKAATRILGGGTRLVPQGSWWMYRA